MRCGGEVSSSAKTVIDTLCRSDDPCVAKATALFEGAYAKLGPTPRGTPKGERISPRESEAFKGVLDVYALDLALSLVDGCREVEGCQRSTFIRAEKNWELISSGRPPIPFRGLETYLQWATGQVRRKIPSRVFFGTQENHAVLRPVASRS